MSSSAVIVPAEPVSRIRWPAIFAGAIAASGVSLALHAFAAGIGLSVASTAPTWRDSSAALWWLSGIYLVFVALCAFAVGGYIAGRMRAPLSMDAVEVEGSDGMHGLVTWALAVVITAVMALGVAATATPALSPSGGSAGASQSVAGENIIASELDELFRSPQPIPDREYRRAEAARILLKSSSHTGVTNPDRRYLYAMVESAVGLRPDQSMPRVDHAITASQQELHRARVAAVLQAFFIGAALFLGAAVAWFSACEGGRDRERGTFPIWSRKHLG
jgi:hypothetical protein